MKLSTTNSADVFLAGEEGAELVVGKSGSTVFPAKVDAGYDERCICRRAADESFCLCDLRLDKRHINVVSLNLENKRKVGVL